MNVSYKGLKQEFSAKSQEKLDSKFSKLAKLLDQRAGQREAHVVVTQERHLYHAEVTVQFYDHQLVSVGSDGDVFTALSGALEKLEAQAHKQVDKFRTRTRHKGNGLADLTKAADPAPEPDGAGKAAPRIFRVNHDKDRKPMTLEEAVLEMERDHDYLVYRDCEKQTVSVLIRRRDGHFDLIES
jgi:putative sigma-54 modulation protein